MSELFSFDLRKEPWVPCVNLDGQPVELGLLDVLCQAHELREVFDASPLVTISLYRLLLAILHHNFGPENTTEWNGLYNQPGFDGASLSRYFEKRKSRFDLFDAGSPFYQTASVGFETPDGKSCTSPVSKLAPELASGNNATLFDHTSDGQVSCAPPSVAARYLIGCQSYSLGGLVTPDKGKHKSAKASTLVGGAALLPQGSTLFETLMLNLHRYSAKAEEPFKFDGEGDLPAWDRDASTQPKQRKLNGYLDLLTWQSRRVRLHPCNVDGSQAVTGAVIMKGEFFPESFRLRNRETMFAFRRNSKATAKQDARPAIRFNESRSLWRDFLPMVQSVSDVRNRPKLMDWLDELIDEGHLDTCRFPLTAFGLANDKAKMLFWRRESIPFHTKYLRDNDLVEALGISIVLAEAASKALSDSVWKYASIIILKDDSTSPSKDDKATISTLTKTFAVDGSFWARINAPFGRLVYQLADCPADVDEHLYVSETLTGWKQELRRIASEIFAAVIGQEDSSAESLRAMAISEGLFNYLLRRCLDEEN